MLCFFYSRVACCVVVAAVVVREIGTRVVRANRAVIGVTQSTAIGRRAGRKWTIVRRVSDGLQAVHRVVIVGQTGGVLLVSGIAMPKFKKGRFRRV